MSKTIELATSLMLTTGIRNEEARTFPRKYVFDPRGSRFDQRKRIPIFLNPSDMSLKGKKARTVYVTWQLMLEMYKYLHIGEGAERANIYLERQGYVPPILFLNNSGNPFAEKGLNDAYRKLSHGYSKNGKHFPPALNFRVTPHMLRHTFATLELYAESETLDKQGRKRGMGYALAWVRDRLGHNSVQSTTIYVHCLQLLETPELNEYQQVIDKILAERSLDS